jgi:hypothetical protein
MRCYGLSILQLLDRLLKVDNSALNVIVVVHLLLGYEVVEQLICYSVILISALNAKELLIEFSIQYKVQVFGYLYCLLEIPQNLLISKVVSPS